VRHGYQLGTRELFFYRLVGPLCEEMGEAYPELVDNRAHVEQVLRREEERFAETLEQGMRILEEDLAGMEGKEIAGATVFRLYDTYGFPVDLTADYARERGLTLDMEGFEREMDVQRDRARAASRFGAEYSAGLDIEGRTDFTGYDHLEDESVISGLFRDGEAVDSLAAGEDGIVILEQTPFYAESGGQVGDRGSLHAGDSSFTVRDTQKHGGGVFSHIGHLEKGTLHVGDEIRASVDLARRRATVLNHSGTHLLHAALRAVLGDHVQQKGSLVEPERLRFDFAHYEPVTPAQLREIEDMVNAHIRANDEAVTRIMSIDDAMNSGAMALFGEKYDAEVRVLSLGEFSVELCGGTHVQLTGDIGLLKIVAETGIAAGVRRIEAVTGEAAMQWVNRNESRLQRVAELVRGSRDDVDEKVMQLLEKNRALEKELQQLKGKLASSQGSDLASQAVDVEGLKVLAARMEGADVKTLRDTLDQLKNKLGSAAVVLAAVNDGKVSLVAGVTKDRTGEIKAGELVNAVASQVGGKGGGRPDMAQAGGSQPENLDSALESVTGWVQQQLSA
jgi:alanyl-tRNA synthetase